MIRSAKNDRENYPRKCVWAQEKETRVKSNPRLSANRPSNNWTQSCCEPLISPLDHLYSPIFHSFCGCPPNFAYPLFFISPGYYSLLKRNWKAYANFFSGGVGGGRGKGGGGKIRWVVHFCSLHTKKQRSAREQILPPLYRLLPGSQIEGTSRK